MARWKSDTRITWKHRLEAGALKGVSRLLAVLPHRAALRLGSGLGLLAWALGIRRKVVIENICRARGLPDDIEGAAEIGRASYRNLGLILAEYARAPRQSLEDLEGRVRFEHVERLEPAIAASRGIIALSGHFGSFELLATSLRLLGFHPSILVAPLRNPLASQFLFEHRSGYGVEVIEIGPRLRQVFRVLRDGGMLCLAADQDAGRDGVFVDFLGRAAATATGPIELALRSGAPIVWGSIYREGLDRHRVEIQHPVFVTSQGSHEETMRHYLSIFAGFLEESVLRRPDHYFWPHRRWKTRPESVPGPSPPQPAGTGESGPM